MEVLSKLRRVGVSDEEAVTKRGPRGFVQGAPELAADEESYEDESFVDDDDDESSKP